MTIQSKKSEIYNLFREKILSGEYAYGFRFAPENELAGTLNVARNTLRNALDLLENEELIARIKSKGTFVTYRAGGRKVLVITQLWEQRHYTYHDIFPGIQEAAREHGWKAVLCERRVFELQTPGSIQNIIKAQKIAGFIVIDTAFTGHEPLLKLLAATHLPVVLAGDTQQDWKITGLASVLYNTRISWKAALAELAAAGHKRIVVGSMDYADGHVRSLLPKELAAIYAELGLDWSGELRFTIHGFDEAAIEENVKRIFSSAKERPTAVLAYSDFWAPAIYRALNTLHLSIPQDVAVQGFSAMPGGEYLLPSLSTVDLNLPQGGAKALELIVDAGRWFGAPNVMPPCVEVPFRIVRRESTAACTVAFAG